MRYSRRLCPNLFLRLILLVCCMFPCLPTLAQEEAIEAAELVAGSAQAKQQLAEQEQLAAASVPAGANQLQTCIFYHQRGMANFRLGRYDASILDLEQALELSQRGKAEASQWGERWRIQNDLTLNYVAASDHMGLLKILQGMVSEYQAKNPFRHFMTLLKQVEPQAALGMLKEANASFTAATALLPAMRSGANWPAQEAIAMNVYHSNAARLQELRGNHAEAERFLRTALGNAKDYQQQVQRQHGADSQLVRLAKIRLAVGTRTLAVNLSSQGKLGEAEILAQDAVRQTLGFSAQNSTAMSNNLSILANIRLQQGKPEPAARFAAMGLAALEGADVKPWSTLLAQRRSRMGLILEMQGRWQDALKLFELRDQGLRSNPQQFAQTASGDIDWAMALQKNGQAARASTMLANMLQHAKAKPFADPQNLAWIEAYLALSLARQGQGEAALPHFRQALPVLLQQVQDMAAANEEGGFVSTWRLNLVLEAYLDLLVDMHVHGDAEANPAASITKIGIGNRGGSVSSVSPAANASVSTNAASVYDALLDPLAESFRIADIARQSAVQRALSASAARATLPDAQLAALARREQDASNQLIALDRVLQRVAAMPQQLPGIMNDMQREIARLGAERAQLRGELLQKYPDYAHLLQAPGATPQAIANSLQTNEALVAIYSGEIYCYVWSITPQSVSLRRVARSREQIAKDVAAILRGVDLSDGQLKRFDYAAARALYQSLLQPDQAQWGQTRLLNVVPHGALSQLPFALLLSADVPAPVATNGAAATSSSGAIKTGAIKTDSIKPDTSPPWLIRKLALAQQSSVSGFLALRQSSRQRSAQAVSRPFLGFGDPLFMAEPATTTNTTMSNVSAAPVVRSLNLRALANDGGALAEAFAMLPALPDTALELQDIAGSTGADKAQDVYLGLRASETNLKSMNQAHSLANYRVLAFATHGLAAGDLPALNQPALALANPLLTHESGNDGWLTMDEVLGLQLNAEWVVLSACNTASSDGQASEAVSGLGRAFFFAGTRSLLVSHWAVETVSARLLTTGLFRQQAAQPAMLRAEALRQSMLGLMQQPAYAHPAFWAAFSLNGDGWR